MATEEILPLVKQKIPTIVGFDAGTGSYTIGDEARRIGLSGRTTVFNFKTVFGLGDKEFSTVKKFWYWVPETPEHPQRTETFTAKDAGQRFLETLLASVEAPEKLIIGEPAIRDSAWRENFRRHMREVLSAIGREEPVFFPEPFAVFQYYRHIDKKFPVANRAEIVLILDIGGGTFNSCIIRTTEQGLLARGGATSLPLGLQAGVCGGAEIDKELLKRVVAKCTQAGVRWKEDPLRRAEFNSTPALLRVEDAKIRLSQEICSRPNARLAFDFSSITASLTFPKGELHAEQDIQQALTGEDLKHVIREMWRRHYGQIICDTVNEARDKLRSALGISLDAIDRVIVAGGSSRLPFIKEEIVTVLPSLVDASNVYIGQDTGEAVAFGIACECREQAKRDPRLSVNKISPCILNDLYLAFQLSRRDPFVLPVIRQNGTALGQGRLLSAPFETETLTQTYEIELPFDANDRLLYHFSPSPFTSDPPPIPLNLTHDVISVPKLPKILRRCELTLEVKPNGMIRPSFLFRGKGSQAAKRGERIECPEFYFAGFQISEGKTYIGLDFGNSNSYLVRFASLRREIAATTYPEFKLSPRVTDHLRQLELMIEKMRAGGMLTRSNVVKHAQDQMLELIFHSNKIEGSPLNKGETAEALSGTGQVVGPRAQEARNLEAAYSWMLGNIDACIDTPEAFIRQINGMITRGMMTQPGEYRTGPVTLGGMDFKPPAAGSVPAFMEELAREIRTGRSDRSALECAVSFHTKLVWIHPFSDGNGRTARLLLDAYLLSQNLPVLVVNYADRERYLHCLSESNKGDLSGLIEFMIECFEQQRTELAAPPAPPETAVEMLIASAADAVETGPIQSALDDAGLVDSDDPLAVVMNTKLTEWQKAVEAEYEAWRQSVLTVPAELRAIVELFNANESYARAGYCMQFQAFDVLTLEKYIDIAAGRNVADTWFVGLELGGPTSMEKVMWSFTAADPNLKKDRTTSRVSVAISRFDGTRYVRLGPEPISMREIGYREGTLVFMFRGGKVGSGSVRRVLQMFLAEAIKAYL